MGLTSENISVTVTDETEDGLADKNEDDYPDSCPRDFEINPLRRGSAYHIADGQQVKEKNFHYRSGELLDPSSYP